MKELKLVEVNVPEELQKDVARMWELTSDDGQVLAYKKRYKVPFPPETREKTIRELLEEIKTMLEKP